MLLPLACLNGISLKFYKYWGSFCDIIRIKRSASCGQVKYSSYAHLLRSPWIEYVFILLTLPRAWVRNLKLRVPLVTENELCGCPLAGMYPQGWPWIRVPLCSDMYSTPTLLLIDLSRETFFLFTMIIKLVSIICFSPPDWNRITDMSKFRGHPPSSNCPA